MNVSFEERVRNELMSYAKLYRQNFIDVEYFIYTSEFMFSKYYTIKAYKDNFLHLTGVSTSLTANEFFDNCLNETLTLEDFSVGNKQQKGTVRRKLSVFSNAMNLFLSGDILVEEKFVKNNVRCSFASSDNCCTMGFASMINSKPQTLLKGNQLENGKRVEVICKKENGIFTIINNQTHLSNEEIEQLFT
ncbi:hypothetical protein KBI51_02525 [Aerococcaceae bacterium zg-ZUI334]|uniref:PBECR4 domain-containing protein n=1 Tax=Aerococcaceae bacterium zg-252 TaxID=2796928 RepID=UPI001B928FFD|nr:hypothetical protein [Aerococcaceae bacterium zg-ZUI334]